MQANQPNQPNPANPVNQPNPPGAPNPFAQVNPANPNAAMMAYVQGVMGPTPPNSPGGTPLTPNRVAAHRLQRTNFMANMFAGMVPQQQAVPQAPIQVAPNVVPLAPPVPRCGGLLQLGAVMMPWTGGGPAGSASQILRPKTTFAYRAVDVSTALKVEKACTEGLPEDCRLPAPGATNATAQSVTFANWLYGLRQELAKRGLDSIFRANVNNEEVYLLQHWGQATKEVISNQIAFLEAHGDTYDQQNLELSAQYILRSLTTEMMHRTKCEIGNGADEAVNGLEVFAAIISLHSVLNDSTERHYVDQLLKLKLVDEPGQNVMTFSDKVLGLARHIDGISGHTKDLHTLVYTSMTGSCNTVFETAVSSLLASCLNGTDNTVRNWENQVTVLRGMYRNLEGAGNWEAAKHTKEAHEPQGLVAMAELEGLKAEVQRLTSVINGASTTGNNTNGGSWTPTCHECGEKGHIKPNCPHRNTSNTGNSNGDGFKKKQAPGPGEPTTKTYQGTTFKWCDTCKKWNSGAKAHHTSEHVKGKGTAAAVASTTSALAQTEPSPSATLAFVAGYMGSISSIDEDPYPFDADTKFIIDKDGHASILSDDGVSSNHPAADFCPFCQQYFPEHSSHNETNLHLKNVQIMQAWECSDKHLDFCTEMLQGMDFIREVDFNNSPFSEQVAIPEEASALGEDFIPEEASAAFSVGVEAVEQAQEIDEDGFIQVNRKAKRFKQTNHLKAMAGQP